MKTLFTILILTFSIAAFGQISFEKGYFIDENGQRTECLIKNEDWRNNPEVFSFQMAEGGAVAQAGLSTVLEFGIYDQSKFIRSEVDIDRSVEGLYKLDERRNPQFVRDTIYLKVLIEGQGSLYAYEGENITRYFYAIDGNPIQQLIYKKYLVSGNRVAINTAYRQQLMNEVKCQAISPAAAESVKYQEISLKKYFLKYNDCVGSAVAVYGIQEERDEFNLKITPGINSTSVFLYNSLGNYDDVELGQSLNFRLGLEMEYILPFNKNKWSILIEPTYQYFNRDERTSSGQFSFQHRYIDVPIGFRYYLFFGEDQKFFLNGFYVSNIALRSSGSSPLIPDNTSMKIINLSSFALGTGLDFGNLSLEIRYYPTRRVIASDQVWETDVKRLALIAGYKLVRAKSGGSTP